MLSLAFVKGSTGSVLLDWLERKATTTDSHRPIYKITKDCQKHNLLKKNFIINRITWKVLVELAYGMGEKEDFLTSHPREEAYLVGFDPRSEIRLNLRDWL